MVKEESFSGFPKKGLQFLEDLRNNNNREWFKARKQDYEKYILVPAKAFVVSLGELLKTLSNDLEYDTRTSGQGSIMRIYRDIRFSKDKTPYNTRLRIRFWEGSKKKGENPGFFFGMDANEAHLYGGLHMFPKPVLASYRDAVIDDRLGKELDAALKSLKSAVEDNEMIWGSIVSRDGKGSIIMAMLENDEHQVAMYNKIKKYNSTLQSSFNK